MWKKQKSTSKSEAKLTAIRKKYSHKPENIQEVGYLHGCTGTTGVFRRVDY